MIRKEPFRTNLVSIDNTALVASYVVDTMVNGQVLDFTVQWMGISRSSGDKICGITRIVASASGGAITFLGTGDKIEIQAPEYDASLSVATMLPAAEGLELSLEATAVDGAGDVDWDIYIHNIKYHKT